MTNRLERWVTKIVACLLIATIIKLVLHYVPWLEDPFNNMLLAFVLLGAYDTLRGHDA
jgi:hypothetical protein